MTFSVKNKFVSLGGGSFVEDDNGNRLFKVKGKVFSPTRKKILCDPNGKKLFVIRNKFWHFFRKSAFIYNADGEKILKLTKKVWTNNFLVETYDAAIDVDGNWVGWNLDVLRDGEVIGHISRQFTVVRDAFRVDSVNSADNALLTAIVVAIDNIFDADKVRA